VCYELKGYTQDKIAELLEVRRCTFNGWLKKAREGGRGALKSRKRGPGFGTRSQLGTEEQPLIRKLITDKHPDQLKQAFAFCSRKAVGDLIWALYRKTLGCASSGPLSASMGVYSAAASQTGLSAPREAGGAMAEEHIAAD